MRVLLVNLKHFYQCRALWLVYLLVALNLVFLGGFGHLMHSFRGPAGGTEGLPFRWMGIICAAGLVVGAIVASLQMDVISKPFSFCLPDHRIVLRKLVLLVGLVLSLLVLLLEFLKDSPASLSPAYLFGVSLTAYCAGVSLGLVSKYGPAVVLIASIVLLMGGPMLDLGKSREFVPTMASTVVTILLGVGSAMAVWWSLGRTGLFRRRCAKPWLGPSELWNPAAREKYRWARAAAKDGHAPDSKAKTYLLGVMKDCKPGSAAQHIWGALYAWLLPGAGGRSRIVWMGLFSFGSAIMAWYGPSMGPFLIANASIYGGAALLHLPSSSPLPIAGGRRERFFATTAVIIVLGGIVTCCLVLGAIAADSFGVHSLTSQADQYYSKSYVHAMVTQSMNLRLVVLFAAVFPISRLLEIRLLGRRILGKGGQGALLLSTALIGQWTLPLLAAIPAWYVAFVFILSWVAGIYGVYRTVMSRDLGRK